SPEFYADSAVIAYRAPDSEVFLMDLHPKITSHQGSVDASLLSEGVFLKTLAVPKAPVGQQAWVQFEFSRPQSIRGLTLALGGPVNPFADILGGALPGPDLEASDDGRTYRKVATVPNDGAQVHTISFPEQTARFFRVSFTTQPPSTTPPVMQFDADFGDFSMPASKEYAIAELTLHSAARVNRAEERAGFAPRTDLYAFPTQHVAP